MRQRAGGRVLSGPEPLQLLCFNLLTSLPLNPRLVHQACCNSMGPGGQPSETFRSAHR